MRERIAKINVRFDNFATAENVADIFTKALEMDAFLKVQSIDSSVKVNGQVHLDHTTTCKISVLGLKCITVTYPRLLRQE